MNAKTIVELLKETFKEWQEDKASRLAAALAYYTAFSIAPLIIIAIAIAAVVFGQEAAQGGIDEQLRGLLGQQGAEAVQEMIKNSRKPSEGTIATLISIVVLLFGASGVFGELQDSLNTIWEVAPKQGQGVMTFIRNRFLSFAMVLGIGFLLLVSLLLSTILAGVSNLLGHMIPNLTALWSLLNFLISFGVITVLFALIYRILPDAEIAWGDVWIGSIITALLFTIGKSLIGLYLGNSSVGSTYGAAGSFVVFLLWVNYSAQILFFGAEFTQVYANKYGSRIVPAGTAVPVTEEARSQQGSPHSRTRNAVSSQNRVAQEGTTRRTMNRRRKRHPIAAFLGGLMGGTSKNRRNQRNR
ncbi:MAG TPA: YihY/virulence factor BrkB family protein [Coleofasciculaceae cyanobacterium]